MEEEKLKLTVRIMGMSVAEKEDGTKTMLLDIGSTDQIPIGMAFEFPEGIEVNVVPQEEPPHSVVDIDEGEEHA